jgi:hypothetical protein
LDENWVEEYAAKQFELADKLEKEVTSRPKEISLRSLVKWEFGTPFSNVIARVPILAQIPFFEQQHLILRPIKTEQDFVDEYGLSVSGVLDLWQQKHRLLVTLLSPSRYIGLDYLDPILEKEPLFLEMYAQVFLQTIANTLNGEEYYASCYDVAFAKFHLLKSMLHKFSTAVGKVASSHDVASLLANAYAVLCGYGFEQLASALLSEMNLESMLALWKYSELFVLYPRYRALDGVVSLDSADFEIVRQLDLEIGAKPFPIDVAKLIVERMQVAFVRNMGWEQAVQLYGKTSELRRLLGEIDRCASKTEFADLYCLEETQGAKTRFTSDYF